MKLSHLWWRGLPVIVQPPLDERQQGSRDVIRQNSGYRLFARSRQRETGFLENGGDVPHNLLADTRHTLALEQNAKEIGFLLDVFKDQPPLRFKGGRFELLRQRLNIAQQLSQTFLQHFHQQLINAFEMPEECDVRYFGAFCDLLDGDGGEILFQDQ